MEYPNSSLYFPEQFPPDTVQLQKFGIVTQI
jgi:hypothetical protein